MAAGFDQALPVVPSADTAYRPGSRRGAGRKSRSAGSKGLACSRNSEKASAVVTGPVSKDQIAGVGFEFPGQTEYFAAVLDRKADDAVMMLAGPQLRTVPMTVHCALSEVPGRLSVALIVARSRIVAEAMRRDFGIPSPRIAICGLNPHAGENGRMGREEIEIIAPAIAALRAEGVDATGPHPADTLFAPRKRATYDVAIAMYHDQALVPLKTLDFDQGQRHARPADRAHFARSRHRVRHRRQGYRRSGRDDRGDPPGRRDGRAASAPGNPAHDPPPLREVIAAHGLSASKALGQNFLFDEQLLARIAAIPGDLVDRAVLEIGPGPGGLTRALLRAGARGHRDRDGPPLPARIGRAG